MRAAPAVRQERVPFIDCYRGFAVASVYLFHAVGISFQFDTLRWNGWWRSLRMPDGFWPFLPLSFGGQLGVSLFFVISGFCIRLTHPAEERRWGNFYMRRFFRIYPAYLVAVIFFGFLMPRYSLSINLSAPEGRAQLLSHLFLVQNAQDSWKYGINPSFWSIAVEAQLYLLYPALFALVARFGWRAAIIPLLIELGCRGAATAYLLSGVWPPSELTYSPTYFWFSWTLGAMIADGYLQGTLRRSMLRPYLLALLACVSYFWRGSANFQFLLFACASAAVLQNRLYRHLSGANGHETTVVSRHLGWTGKISYSVYLLHQPLLGAAVFILRRTWPSQANPLTAFGLCLFLWPFILVLAALLYRLVEEPAYRWAKIRGEFTFPARSAVAQPNGGDRQGLLK